MFRILLIPVFAYTYLTAEHTRDYWFATSVLALTAVTDMFDGYIARHFNMITNLGKMLDPVADKLTQAVMIVCLSIRFRQIWIVACIFLVKEGFMLVMGVKNLRRGRMLDGALMAGKVCTTVLFVSMGVIMLFPKPSQTLLNAAAALCILAMAVSFLFYLSTYRGGDHGVDIVPLREGKEERGE